MTPCGTAEAWKLHIICGEFDCAVCNYAQRERAREHARQRALRIITTPMDPETAAFLKIAMHYDDEPTR